MSQPWTEKYRPHTLSAVAHQEEAVASLKRCVQLNSVPHMMFYGPPGVGKTSAVYAFACELFGKNYRDHVVELNASTERGIKAIRETVKKIAQQSVSAQEGIPSIRIIILDEADALTKDAQSALRRIMEDYAQTTRMAILCNYASRIIDPIASRCAKFRFSPLPEIAIQQRLKSIAKSESILYLLEGRNGESISAVGKMISSCSRGDMRRAVTLMQMLKQFALTELESETNKEVEAENKTEKSNGEEYNGYSKTLIEFIQETANTIPRELIMKAIIELADSHNQCLLLEWVKQNITRMAYPAYEVCLEIWKDLCLKNTISEEEIKNSEEMGCDPQIIEKYKLAKEKLNTADIKNVVGLAFSRVGRNIVNKVTEEIVLDSFFAICKNDIIKGSI